MRNLKSFIRSILIGFVYRTKVILPALCSIMFFGCALSNPTRESLMPADSAAPVISTTVRTEENVILGLRRDLVETATRFIGVPYTRGGNSAEEGFDCSGLTMAVYHLNGLELPRESARQFKVGRYVERQGLQKGDLVFFAIDGGPKVSHVGLYIGNGKFIHAPRPGKTVRIARLDSVYFKKRYVGGRSYF